MLTLREALQSHGTVPGYVDVVVARQTTSQPTLTHCCSSDVLSDTPPPTVELHRSCSDKSSKRTAHEAKNAKVKLRNVSYQLANGDSFVSNQSSVSTPWSGTVVNKSLAAKKAPTIHGGHPDTVLIETDESLPSSVSLSRCFFSIRSPTF